MKIFGVLCLIAVVGFSEAFPRAIGYYPRAYMLGGSFYANPRYVREESGYEYIPPGQMTAMVVGDTVATNSFSGPGFNPPQTVVSVPNADVGQLEEHYPERVTEQQQPILIPIAEPELTNETEPEEDLPAIPVQNFKGEQETLFSLEDATTEAVVLRTTKAAPVVPSRAPSVGRKVKTVKAKRPVIAAPPQPAEEEEEEADEEETGLSSGWPFGGSGRAGIPNYNAFFPIFIGGSSPSGRSRTRSAEGQEAGYPGSATAIANAFSTGKGGVATSHATSFGDPYAAAMFRNAGLFNYKKGNKKQKTVDEEEEE